MTRQFRSGFRSGSVRTATGILNPDLDLNFGQGKEALESFISIFYVSPFESSISVGSGFTNSRRIGSRNQV
jgi:hypothetical protein